jgi:hypothetical protein
MHGHNVVSPTVAEAQPIINDTTRRFGPLVTDIQRGNHVLGKSAAKKRPGTPMHCTSGRALADGLRSLFVEPSAALLRPFAAQDLTDAVSKLLSPE